MKKKIIILSACIVLLTGCTTPTDVVNQVSSELVENLQETVTEAPEEASAAPEEEEQEKDILDLGKKSKLTDWTVTVNKAEIRAKIQDGQFYAFKPDKGNKFIYITATVRNNGKKKSTFLPTVVYDDSLDATLYYEDKYEYSATNLLGYDKDLHQQNINPLTKKKGVIAFEVPKKVAKKKGKLILELGTEEESVYYSLK